MSFNWKNLPLQTKGFVVVSLPVTALLISVILINRVQLQKSDAEAWMRRAMDGRTEIRSVYIALLSAESAVRYYALSGDKEGLRPYQAAGPLIDASLERVEQSVRDNPEQLRRLPLIRQLAHKRLEELEELKASYGVPEGLPQQSLLRDGKTAMDVTLQEIHSAYDAQNRVLQKRTQEDSARQSRLQIVIAGSAAIWLLGGLFAIVLFTRGIMLGVHELERNADRLEKGLPPASIASGNDELGRLARALERTGAVLALQREELKLALESARVLIWELEPDTGRIRYQAGSEALGTAGFSPQMIPETVDAWISAVHAEDRIDVRDELNRILAEGGSFQIEYRVALRGGEIRWIAVKGQYHSEAGPRRMLGVLTDVTERRRASEDLARSQDALHRQTRILQLILDSMGDAVAVADENGQFLVFNPAAERILGRGTFEGDPSHWSEHYGICLPDTVTVYPSENLPLARAIRGESVDADELFLRPPDSEEGIWISVTARPLLAEAGEIRGGVAVFRDVTVLKRDQEELRLAKQAAENANHAKSEFLSRMSHELRTPLNSILGFAQLLDLSELTVQQTDNVQHILKGGYHLLELINEVLDLARIEAGRLSLSPEPVRMREALKDALDLIRPLAVRQKVSISPEIAIRCDRHVQADRQRLKQVLLNLLSNAVKFNRSGGSVTLSCEVTPENKLRIEIADTGVGISPEGLDRLFQPFERLGADLTGVEGTGLGLALSRHLVEAMGGSIGAESTLGEGSRFYVELSLLEDPADQLDPDGMPAMVLDGDHGSQQGTVLYIEDNLSNLRLMERILSHRPGVKLISAMQAQLGLDLAQTQSPDWILLDLHLPDLPGEEVLRRLRGNPQTDQIPVTIVSADATPGQIDRLMAAGARNYLTKPLDVRKLLKLLEKTMRRGESHNRRMTESYAERNSSE